MGQLSKSTEKLIWTKFGKTSVRKSATKSGSYFENVLCYCGSVHELLKSLFMSSNGDETFGSSACRWLPHCLDVEGFQFFPA